ncbi:MAG: hypothetical protein M1365_00930 [Actinobacteria bacterium]|nr:hypothetical protein [Actinomycetota bacterium]
MPDSLNAVYLAKDDRAIICINSKLNRTQRECALTHELIHHEYYPECNFYKCNTYYDICQCNWIENRIEEKTARWLISDSILESLVIPYVDVYPLSDIADEVNVTEDLLKLRLEIYKKSNKKFSI